MNVWLIILLSIIAFLLVWSRLCCNNTLNPGYTIINQLISKPQVDTILNAWENKHYSFIKNYFMQNESIRAKLKSILGDDYTLIDYSYLIENSTIHTFHRDYTSSQNYNGLKYPSYTMILYLDDYSKTPNPPGLSVIPSSHLHKFPIYFRDPSKTIYFNQGDAVLFDADLFHSGLVSDVRKRHCIQFKVIHKEDVDKMPWLQKFHVVIDRANNKPIFLKQTEHAFTKHLPFTMDIFQGIIKTSFSEHKNWVQKAVSKVVFSSEDFYKPNKI